MWLATLRGWCLIGRLWLERGVAGRSALLSEAFRWVVSERVEVPCFTYPCPHTHCLCACVRGAREGRKNERTDGETGEKGRH